MAAQSSAPSDDEADAMKILSDVVLRTQTDERLITLAGRGSAAAFEALVQRYRRPLQAYCRRMLVSDGRTDDVVQHALLNAWTALQAGTTVREPRAWLYRITHNQAISALREPEYDFDELTESLRGAEAPESQLEQRMLIRETLAAVAALPARQQEVILRTAVEGQSYEEVAAALDLSSHAVRGLVHRARTSLRSALAAVTPTPFVLWAAGNAQRGGGLQQWLGISLTGGATGGAAVALKSATVLATSAAIVGGTLAGPLRPPVSARAIHHPARASMRSPAARLIVGSAATVRPSQTRTVALTGTASTSAAGRVSATIRPATRNPPGAGRSSGEANTGMRRRAAGALHSAAGPAPGANSFSRRSAFGSPAPATSTAGTLGGTRGQADVADSAGSATHPGEANSTAGATRGAPSTGKPTTTRTSANPGDAGSKPNSSQASTPDAAPSDESATATTSTPTSGRGAHGGSFATPVTPAVITKP
jgi:RNA polymerase sigma factor (sigma-70 family)